MKNYLTLLTAILFFCSGQLAAQNDTIWFDTNWNETLKKDATFYRPEVKKKGKGYWITDYYLSGQKQMEGLSVEHDAEVFDGEVTWYHDNGKVHQIVNYSKGHLHGDRSVYFSSGQQKSESSYKNGKLNGAWKSHYENGQIKDKGKFDNDQKEGAWETYYDNGQLKEEGKYVFDKKVDVWKTHYYDGQMNDE